MDEFVDWLLEHEERFKTYSTQEIKDIAIACGFESSIVDQWVTKAKFGGTYR